MNSPAPSRINAEKDYHQKLENLPEQRRPFVEHFLETGNGTESARAAGYSEKSAKDLARRILKDPKVKAAISAGLVARDARLELDQEGACAYLETMLKTGWGDVFEVDLDGRPVAIKDLSALSPAQTKSFKKLSATIRRTASGKSSHLVKLDVETRDPVGIIAELAKLRGWTSDSPLIDFRTENVYASAPHQAEQEVRTLDLNVMADAVLSDNEISRFVALDRDEDKLRMIGEAASRLRAARETTDEHDSQ